MAIDKPQISFNLIPEKQVEAAIANDYTRIDWAGRSTKNIAKATGQIRESIAQGIREGKDYSQMANAVSDRMGKSAADMQRIARTEGHRAREQGNLDSLQYAHEKGLNLEKEWVSALDERTRDAHAILDGETVGINEEFVSSTGGRGQGPGLMSTGEDNINCRCSLVGVTPGEKFEYRGYRYDDAPGSYIGKYSNYMNWAEKKGIKPHLFIDAKPGVIKGNWGDRLYTDTMRAADERLAQLRKNYPVPDEYLQEHGDWLKMRQGAWDRDFDSAVKDVMMREPNVTLAQARERVSNAFVSRPSAYDQNIAGQYMHNRIGLNPTGWQANDSLSDSIAFRDSVLHGSRKGQQTLFQVASGNEGTMIHEYGHALHASTKNDKAIQGYFNSLTSKQIEEGISYYAATDHVEFFAECFTESLMPNPRPMAVEMMRIWRGLK